MNLNFPFSGMQNTSETKAYKVLNLSLGKRYNNLAPLYKDTVQFTGHKQSEKCLKAKFEQCEAELNEYSTIYIDKLRKCTTTKDEDLTFCIFQKAYFEAAIDYKKSMGEDCTYETNRLASINKTIEGINTVIPPIDAKASTPKELIDYLSKYGDLISYDIKKEITAEINRKKANEVIKPGDKKLILPKQNYTNEEQSALRYYLGDYSQINHPLLLCEISPVIQSIVQTLDGLIDKNEGIKDDAVVYRSILTKNINSMGVDLKKEYTTVGNIVTYKPYMSTSLGPGGKYQNFERFDYRYSDKYDGITLRIHLPKGTKGVMVTEDEFLLGRNSKLKITAYDENTHVVECEYILPE